MVGDRTATGAVTFWGAQWSKRNVLTGGTAPAAFKGFALNPTTPSCGTAWTTDPGNSAPPPPALPAYIAVIVTSTVTQAGSQISGNTAHIVIVKTNTGYDPNAGHAGTGTVVARSAERTDASPRIPAADGNKGRPASTAGLPSLTRRPPFEEALR